MKKCFREFYDALYMACYYKFGLNSVFRVRDIGSFLPGYHSIPFFLDTIIEDMTHCQYFSVTRLSKRYKEFRVLPITSIATVKPVVVTFQNLKSQYISSFHSEVSLNSKMLAEYFKHTSRCSRNGHLNWIHYKFCELLCIENYLQKTKVNNRTFYVKILHS